MAELSKLAPPVLMLPRLVLTSVPTWFCEAFPVWRMLSIFCPLEVL